MAESTNVRAAKLAASAQKPQHDTLALAAVDISSRFPDFLQSLVIRLLESGKAYPEDFSGKTPYSNTPKPKEARKRGRRRKGVRPFPTSFPEDSGITWSNLYDARTKKILDGVTVYLAKANIFGADLEDVVLEIREALPFCLQKFSPVPGKPDARYSFTANALFNLAKSKIGQRRREIQDGLPTISLEETLDDDGELPILDTVPCEDNEQRVSEALEVLRVVFPLLEERDQAIAFMSAYLDLSVEQIGERLGMSQNGVHYRLVKVIPRVAKKIAAQKLGETI